jgi:putative aminopeptidase FrvX
VYYGGQVVSAKWCDGSAYYFKQGTSPWLLVAHADSWQSQNPNLEVINNVMRNKTGVLGADDRAGVYAINRLLTETTLNPSVLITNGEEIGGLGAKQFAAVRYEQLKDYKIYIELDYPGDNNATMYHILKFDSDIQLKYIKEHGFEFSPGSYSDVSFLTEVSSVPNINFSVCYYNQHWNGEYLKLDLLERNIERFKVMFREFELN